jgi:hypothetical protein
MKVMKLRKLIAVGLLITKIDNLFTHGYIQHSLIDDYSCMKIKSLFGSGILEGRRGDILIFYEEKRMGGEEILNNLCFPELRGFGGEGEKKLLFFKTLLCVQNYP